MLKFKIGNENMSKKCRVIKTSQNSSLNLSVESGPQRYEGASTIYGPHTQRAHQQQFASLFDSLLKVNIKTSKRQKFSLRLGDLCFLYSAV